jgi:hypothetical protein
MITEVAKEHYVDYDNRIRYVQQGYEWITSDKQPGGHHYCEDASTYTN